jgi:large subunit ribosomal protein L22
MLRDTCYVTKMKVNAQLNNLRITPRKVKLVADLICGLDIDDAIAQLNFTVKRTSPYMKKLLESAIANAENNFGLDRNNLYVFDAIVGAGASYKRWMPRAYGRASMILKRTSQINLILEERIEGKGRKTKEQMEKEKKQRADAKKKAEKERKEEKEKKDKTSGKESAFSKTPSDAKTLTDKATSGEKKKEVGKTWTSKIFRRKSM